MRLNGFVPRLVVLAAVWLLATATLTLAAGRQMSTPPAAVTPAAKAAAAPPAVLVVPNVSGQVYVFAKGILEDGGFGWQVGAGAPGYPGNVVVSQSPSAGTRVVDTGAPRIALRLRKSGAQKGLPDSASPYRATPIRLADLAVARPLRSPAKAPAAVKPRATQAAKPATKPAARRMPKARTPDFTVAGARREPLEELPLPDRARALDRWLATNPRPSDANVSRWLYQHSWIVTGAEFGWWHGAEALEILISADRRAQSAWGIGARSERLARAALAEVKARQR